MNTEKLKKNLDKIKASISWNSTKQPIIYPNNEQSMNEYTTEIKRERTSFGMIEWEKYDKYVSITDDMNNKQKQFIIAKHKDCIYDIIRFSECIEDKKHILGIFKSKYKDEQDKLHFMKTLIGYIKCDIGKKKDEVINKLHKNIIDSCIKVDKCVKNEKTTCGLSVLNTSLQQNLLSQHVTAGGGGGGPEIQIYNVRYGFEFESFYFVNDNYISTINNCNGEDDVSGYEEHQVITSYFNNKLNDKNSNGKMLYFNIDEDTFKTSKYDTSVPSVTAPYNCNIQIPNENNDLLTKYWTVGTDMSVRIGSYDNEDTSVCYFSDITHLTKKEKLDPDNNTYIKDILPILNKREKSMDDSFQLYESLEITSPILKYNDIATSDSIFTKHFNIFEKNVEQINITNTDGTIEIKSNSGKEIDILPFNTEFTSNHVHVSILNHDLYENANSLLKICMAWWYFEPLFLILVGHWRRNNKYCVPIRQFMTGIESRVDSPEDFFKTAKYDEYDLGDICDLIYIFNGGRKHSNRYKTLNLLPLEHIGTIEFRLKHGSYEPEENVNFMLLLGFFVCAAVNNIIVCDIIDTNNKQLLWDLYDYNDLNKGILAKKQGSSSLQHQEGSSGEEGSVKKRKLTNANSPNSKKTRTLKPLFHTETSLKHHADNVKETISACLNIFIDFLKKGNNLQGISLNNYNNVIKYLNTTFQARSINRTTQNAEGPVSPVSSEINIGGGTKLIDTYKIGNKMRTLYIRDGKGNYIPVKQFIESKENKKTNKKEIG